MAALCRSSLTACSRALAAQSKTVTLRTLSPTLMASPFSSPSRSLLGAVRVISVLGSVESLMPLHSAVASARLNSKIALDSSCWSWLSQDFAVPR